jgi:hypothetical protein
MPVLWALAESSRRVQMAAGGLAQQLGVHQADAQPLLAKGFVQAYVQPAAAYPVATGCPSTTKRRQWSRPGPP